MEIQVFQKVLEALKGVWPDNNIKNFAAMTNANDMEDVKTIYVDNFHGEVIVECKNRLSRYWKFHGDFYHVTDHDEIEIWKDKRGV